MLWEIATRTDPRCRALADRHYSRQKIGAKGFVPPGRCLVLYARTDSGEATWVTSWPFAEYVMHRWAGAWVCSLFRNEGAALSSALVTQAVAATKAYYGEPPDLGMITFVEPAKIRSSNPGYCYLRAGWLKAGTSVGGKPCLQILPDAMPAAQRPLGWVETYSTIQIRKSLPADLRDLL